MVLPLTREWIEITAAAKGLIAAADVLPLTREWIEIPSKLRICVPCIGGSPSYEGVD